MRGSLVDLPRRAEHFPLKGMSEILFKSLGHFRHFFVFALVHPSAENNWDIFVEPLDRLPRSFSVVQTKPVDKGLVLSVFKSHASQLGHMKSFLSKGNMVGEVFCDIATTFTTHLES